jgi:hypothetical protein
MFRKEFYLYHQEKGRNLETVIRNYTKENFVELIQIQAESFPPPFPSELWWNEEQLTNHVTLFPEGALCGEAEGVLAGSMTGLLVKFCIFRKTEVEPWAHQNSILKNWTNASVLSFFLRPFSSFQCQTQVWLHCLNSLRLATVCYLLLAIFSASSLR